MKKEGDAFTRIDKMKKKIPIFLLLKCMGLTRKKILLSLNETEIIPNLEQQENLTIEKSLLKINDIVFENEKEPKLLCY